MPTYFLLRLAIVVTLMKRSSMAGATFCEFVLSEGDSLKGLMELLRVFVSLVLSDNKLDTGQIEGFPVGVASLCNSLASESSFLNAHKEWFAGNKMKCLFAAASTGHGQSSIFDMFEALTKLLLRVAYRCHVKSGTEIPKQSVSSTKRKKSSKS
ncbi:hypothetical protein Ddye_029856 [Dipteronia dyeriana]|uniref:Uncharacterized protein n=1 Tax=Dipteronia dyeriana TaxID=168575 RepID=A0AAD9TF71_9ROSI|nr:hypothetical protein Ddye_029856 [Dipteronia dyeriana]